MTEPWRPGSPLLQQQGEARGAVFLAEISFPAIQVPNMTNVLVAHAFDGNTVSELFPTITLRMRTAA
jgi:hypothetical protein